MRATIAFAAFLLGCGRPAPPEPAHAVTPSAKAAVPAPSTSASAPPMPSTAQAAPEPDVEIVPLVTTANTAGWKTLEAKQGFALAYPNAIFTTSKVAHGVALRSKLAVNMPHGDVPKSPATEHRFSARIELRDEGVPEAMKRELPYLFDTVLPSGELASFTPAEDLAFRTRVGAHDAYVVLSGAHGYATRHYFVVFAPGKTLTVRFDVLTDYLAPAMPKAWAMTEERQIEIADAIVLSLSP